MNQPAKTAFITGYDSVRFCDRFEVMNKVMAILDVNNRTSFDHYRTGRLEIKDESKILRLEKLFAIYGVEQVWGTDKPKPVIA